MFCTTDHTLLGNITDLYTEALLLSMRETIANIQTFHHSPKFKIKLDLLDPSWFFWGRDGWKLLPWEYGFSVLGEQMSYSSPKSTSVHAGRKAICLHSSQCCIKLKRIILELKILMDEGILKTPVRDKYLFSSFPNACWFLKPRFCLADSKNPWWHYRNENCSQEEGTTVIAINTNILHRSAM